MTDQFQYCRPLVQTGPARPDTALTLAGGWGWFTQVEIISRTGPSEFVQAADLPSECQDALCAPRPPVAGIDLSQPRIMGILNVTPDSFSDGGAFNGSARAVTHGQAMAAAGADLIDIGGESTRPGAVTVPPEAEIARVEAVIRALHHSVSTPISIDTRKTLVAEAAVTAGASLVNDVSGFTYDKSLAPFCAKHHLPVCVMHAQGDPATMQDNPCYDDVLLDVYDFLDAQICMLVEAGIPRHRIIADPGIGFGKSIAHNLRLLSHLSLFHGLGVPILLGASRKGFIRTLGQAPAPQDRAPGSIAVALAAVAQGVQFLRVHDVAETRQALRLWRAVAAGQADGI